MEPSPTCAGINCDRYRGRLARGMCISHYNAWRAVSPDKRKIKSRPKAVGCTVPGCEVDLIQGRGWCAKHYSRWRNHGDPLWEPPRRPESCAADDCERPNYSLGYCVMHYNRVRTHGDPDANPKTATTPTCDVEGCDKPSPSMAYCPMHRDRLKRNGNFERQSLRTRHSHSMGYQLIKRAGHPVSRDATGWVYEHRVVLFDAIGPGWHACHHCGMSVSWELTYPENPDALVVDHLDEDRANNERSNLVPSCAPCNFARSNRWVKQRRKASNQ